MSLDLDAARRQDLTRSFRQADVDALLAGTLTMSPHPAWTLPEQPTWHEDPFADRNWCFQYHMLRWLEPLRKAAAAGHDDAYAMWLRWVQSWVDANLEERSASSWAWTDMSDGLRTQFLCFAAPLVAERSPELLDRFEHAIRVHVAHLQDERNIGKANHAMHQHESLFVAGRVLGEEPLWQLALRRMSALLHEQYDEEGINAEGALAYHFNNFLWWERTLKRVDLEGVDRPAGAERHLHAPEALAHGTRPDGTLVSIGDTDTQSPASIERPETDWVSSNGAQGAPPAELVKVYSAGYVFGRSGWGCAQRPYAQHSFYSVRFGPSKRVHGHPDGTSVTYSASGVNWLLDPGKYSYTSSPERLYMTSRAAHNVLSVQGRRARTDVDVRLVRQNITAEFHDVLLEDPTFVRAPITRRVIWCADGEFLVVVDQVDAGGRAVRATQRWLLGPEVHADVDGATVRLDQGPQRAAICVLGANVQIGTVRGRTDPFEGWMSYRWKAIRPATAVLASVEAVRPQLVTVIAAGRGRAPSAQLLPSGSPHELQVQVDTGAGVHTLRITPDQVLSA